MNEFSEDLEFLTQGGNVVLGYFWDIISGIRQYRNNDSNEDVIQGDFGLNAFRGWRIPKK